MSGASPLPAGSRLPIESAPHERMLMAWPTTVREAALWHDQLAAARDVRGFTRELGRGTMTVVAVAERISCMECGGEAVLVQMLADNEVFEAGDVVVYRCRDCGHRWDVVVDEDDLLDDAP
jgi:hypothetical protein